MTSKYREALDSFNKGVFAHSDAETIRQALRIAERLESGEVSEAMLDTIHTYLEEHKDYSLQKTSTQQDAFVYHLCKAMVKVMIEEAWGE